MQEADGDGTVTFTTVFPGCYDGRWPHVHAENLAATSLDSDTVFSDGYRLQLAKVSGTVPSGMTARLTVPV